MHAHARPLSPTLSIPSIVLVCYFSFGHPPVVCVGPWLLLSGTHRSIYLSSQVCVPQTHTSPLLFSPSMPPYVQYGSTQVHTPAPLLIDLIPAHYSSLDIVGLLHHLLAAPLSPCLSLRALFASNTCMHVYVPISLHIARSTIILFPHAPIDLPH